MLEEMPQLENLQMKSLENSINTLLSKKETLKIKRESIY